MPDEQQQQAARMAEYHQQMEEHEFLKREGLKAWVDIILDMMGDRINQDRRPIIVEGLARFMGIGAPQYPTSALTGPFPDPHMAYIVGGPPQELDAEFITPFFEETTDDVTTVWDWRAVAASATHAKRELNTVGLWYYNDLLMILEGPAAESFWKWQEQARGPFVNGPVFINKPKRMRRKSRRPQA